MCVYGCAKGCRLRLKNHGVFLNYGVGGVHVAHPNILICNLVCMLVLRDLTRETMIYGKPRNNFLMDAYRAGRRY